MMTVPEALDLAVKHHQAGKHEQAEHLYRQILEVNPDHIDALHLLGVIACQAGRTDMGIQHITKALRLYPEFADAHNNLGLAFEDQDRFEEAVASFRQALALKPDYAEAYKNLGYTLRCQGKLDEAAACYQQALRLKPEYGEAHKNLGIIRLLQGKLEEGWTEYEWRWRDEERFLQDYSQPVWDGSPLNGRTILIHPDQGLGDILNFVRYLPLLQKAGGRVIFACPAELMRLLQSCQGIEQLVPAGTALPPFDVHVPLLWLPRLLGTTTVERIPADVPYLTADPELVQKWRTRLESVPGKRIGIAWQSSTSHRGHGRKSVPLKMFAPLANVKDVNLVSLQKGQGLEQLDPLPGLAVNLGPELTDLAETAAVVRNLDLVVSIDSAVAHLAGTLAVPVWVPLPSAPDWRWLVEREDSPWYPTMRLFRQQLGGSWEEVFSRIKNELTTDN